MTATQKRPVKPEVRRHGHAPAEAVDAALPFLRFHHSEELRARTLAVLAKVEHAPDPVRHREALADVAVALADAGIDCFFMQSLKRANVGFIIQTSATVGMAGGMQVIGTVIRNIIERMNGPQLISVCASLRQFMR